MYRILRVNYNTQTRIFSTSVIYDQSQMEAYSGLGPKCNLEINEAGSLDFTLMSNHPLIDELMPGETFIQAFDGDEEIFYGRILDKSDPTMSGQVTFTCEGGLSFLLDGEVHPYGKDADGNQITQELKAKDFFRWCIDQYNAEIDNDPRRRLIVGTIRAAKRNKTDTYSITDYTQVKSAIESQILDVYGGFIRIRPVPGEYGVHYIDWIEEYETLNPQEVTIGTNVRSQTNQFDANSMFTVLRPIGKDGIELTEKTIDLYSGADMAKYGRIIKTIKFESAETEADLRSEAQDYQERLQKTLFVTSSIQRVDMHYIDGTSPKVRLGDRFSHIHGLEGTEMTAASLSLDFEHPENDQLDLRNRKSLDPDLTPEGNRHKSTTISGKTAKSKKTNAQYFKYLKEMDDTLEVLAPKVYMHGETLTQHYQQILQNAGYYESLSSRVDSAEGIISAHTARFNDVEYNIREIEGTGVIQNSQFISNLSGKFEIWTDANGNVTVHLKDGAELAVDDTNGGQISVGTRLAQVATDVNDVGTIVDTISGSALWTQRNQITGVCGEYDIQTQTVDDPEHPGQTKVVKTLVVKSGGGMKIRRDGVEYGLYDNGNLNGGIMVDMINNQTTTKILGDRVDINASNVSIRTTQTLDSVIGHFEEKWVWDVDDQGERVKRYYLEYQADAGMVSKRLDADGVMTEYGVFDEGNLTGGILVTRINGQSAVQIKGSKVLVGDGLDAENLPDWASDAEGMISARATIGQLNAVSARVGDIEADYITTQNIKSRIGDIDQLLVKRIAGSTVSSDAYFDTFQGHHFEVSFSGGGNQTYTRDLIDGVYDLQIVPPASGSNTYTLQKKKIGDNSWTDVGTFSRATTLTGERKSGGVFEVKATPQGDTYHVNFPVTQPNSFSNSIAITTANGNYNYYLDDDTDNAVKLYTTDNGTTPIVAKYTHGKYTAGFNACKNSIECTKGWSTTGVLEYNTNYTVYAKYTPEAGGSKVSADSITFTTPVDRYNSGYSDGYTACKNSISCEKGWSNATLGYATNYTVYAKYTPESGGNKVSAASLTFTTPADRYSTGFNACKNSISCEKSWTTTGVLGYNTNYTVYAKYTPESGGSKVSAASITFTTPVDRYNSGYNDGYDEGYDSGYDDGYDAGYDANSGITWYSPDGQSYVSADPGSTWALIGSCPKNYAYYCFRIRTSRGSKYYKVHILQS